MLLEELIERRRSLVNLGDRGSRAFFEYRTSDDSPVCLVGLEFRDAERRRAWHINSADPDAQPIAAVTFGVYDMIDDRAGIDTLNSAYAWIAEAKAER
jgi:hypothetical protein